MDQRRAVRARRQRLDHHGERVDVDADGLCEILGLPPGMPEASSDAFAGEPHLVARQRPVVRRLEPLHVWHDADCPDTLEIVRHEHPIRAGLGLVDGAQSAMADGTTYESDLHRPWNVDIGDIFAASTQEPRVFLARQPGADSQAGGFVCHGCS